MVHRLAGLMEEKTRQLRQAGTFAAYREIHADYAGLVSDPDSGTEALKRALFLGWLSSVEPACFTGVAELEQDAQRVVLEELGSRAKHDALDAELRWMLSWYYSVADYYFAGRMAPALQAILRSEGWPVPPLAERDCQSRGQMGRYWATIVTKG